MTIASCARTFLSSACIVLVLFNSTYAMQVQPQLPSLSPVTITIDSTVPVGAYQLTIEFDRNYLRLDQSKITVGAAIGFAQSPLTVSVDNQTGTLIISAFQTRATPSGRLVVATLPFTAAARGEAALRMKHVTVTDTNGRDAGSSARLALSATTVRIQ